MTRVLHVSIMVGVAATAFIDSQAQQVGIGTSSPHPSAKLEISSPDKGVLLPRLGINSLNSPSPVAASPAVGLLVFNNGSAGITPKGFYWWDGNKWRILLDSVSVHAPLVGDGTINNPVGLQHGSGPGDILVWNGTTWQIQQPGPSSGVTPLCNSVSTNYLQKWTGTVLCNSLIYDDGTNVGIGTTSPGATLHIVSGSLAGIYSTINSSNTDILQLRHPVTWWRFHIDASGHAELGVHDVQNNITRWNIMDIDPATGNIGIGADANVSYKLYINGRIKTIGINETSDKRLKTRIRNIDNGLDAVLNLQGVYYEWQDSLVRQGYPSGVQAGFMAQEVFNVLPMVVEQDQEGYYSVEYTRIIPFLVEAIKTLEKRISQVEAENKILKQQLNYYNSTKIPLN